MEKEKIIMDNWMEFHPVITEDDLGWNEECIRDAMSDDPKDIFDYFWRNFFSILKSATIIQYTIKGRFMSR